jgi:8-oxo-dGTP diphosphatase
MKEVSVGILRRNGLVLACQRKKSAQYPLKWEFPGGKIERGESPTEAIIRELHEELNVQATPGAEFHRQEWDYGDFSYRVYYYAVDRFAGEPVNQAFEQIRWVKPGELLGMDILEGNRDVVQRLCKERFPTTKQSQVTPPEGAGQS